MYTDTGLAYHASFETYIVINTFRWGSTSGHDVIVISMINQEEATGFNAFLEITNGLFLFTLITERVHHMSEGVTKADNRIKSFSDDWTNVIVERKPICFFDNYMWKRANVE